MNKYLINISWPVATAVSGSIIYKTVKDIYKVHRVYETHVYDNSHINKGKFKNVMNYFNPGLFIGLSLGMLNLLLDNPIFKHFSLDSNFKILKILLGIGFNLPLKRMIL